MKMQSLLDSASPTMSYKAAIARLAELREQLTKVLDRANLAQHGREIREIVKAIAECRVVVGAPQFMPRDFTNAPKRSDGQSAQQQKPKEGGHFIAHAGKRH